MTPDRRDHLKRAFAALVCAAGMVLGTADYRVWWLGFVAWIPWFWMQEGTSPRRAFMYGWLCGTVTVFVGFRWMSVLLVKFGGIPLPAAWPISLLFAMSHGLLWAITAYAIVWMRARTGRGLMLIGPLVWIVTEAALPNIFPIYMAQIWSFQPVLIQTAEIGGVTAIGGVMVAVNAALYTLVSRWVKERRIDRNALIVAAVFGLGNPLYGALRMAQVDEVAARSQTVRFGVVQGNMSIAQMGSREWRPRILAGQQRVSAELEAQGAEVVLWGETAYPNSRAFRRDAKTDLPEGDPWRVRRGFDIPVIFGALTRAADDPFGWNTALLIDEQGRIRDWYDKVYLLVFGEYIPLVDPEWFMDIVPGAAHLNRGDGAGVLRLGEYRLGPLICYEDILPRFVRDAASEDVHAFVNLTNDSWFGKTHEPAQHLGLGVFRAIEHRRALVRAVNTGISAYVDPAGRVTHELRVVDPDVDGPQPAEGFTVDVPMMGSGDGDGVGRRTVYGVTGELFNVCAGFALLGLLWGSRRRPPAAQAVSDGTPSP